MDGDSGGAGYLVIGTNWTKRRRHWKTVGCGASLFTGGLSAADAVAASPVHDVRSGRSGSAMERISCDRGVEVHRLRCPECGVRGRKKIEQLPSKAPFRQAIEESWGSLARSAPPPVSGPGASTCRETTVRAIDLRYLERWNQAPPQPGPSEEMGVGPDLPGEERQVSHVVSNLETGEPTMVFGKERKKETLDEDSGRNQKRASGNASRPLCGHVGALPLSIERTGLRKLPH